MLDLRLPIGWFFLINSLLIIIVGITEPQKSTVYFGAQLINLNLVWGMIMAAFGLLMLGLGYWEKSSSPKAPPAPSAREAKLD